MCDSLEDFPDNEIWKRCYNPKWKDVLYHKWEVVLSAPDRVNIPCLMLDTRLCQIYFKITHCFLCTDQQSKICVSYDINFD